MMNGHSCLSYIYATTTNLCIDRYYSRDGMLVILRPADASHVTIARGCRPNRLLPICTVQSHKRRSAYQQFITWTEM